MSVNHSVSDLVAIIRNGYLARKRLVSSPISSLRENILKILKEEGYITNYSKVDNDSFGKFDIHLKYNFDQPVVSNISVVSKPGKRVYCSADNIPIFKNGLGMIIISSSKGIIADYNAKKHNVGGEVLLKIF